MTTLITGATGFIGGHLIGQLHETLGVGGVLSRNPDRAANALGTRAFPWTPGDAPPHADAFRGVDTVFHLAGDPVARGRWTAAKKARIRDSRVLGTRQLVERLRTLDNPPKTLVSASAVGFYGSRGNEVLDEGSTPSSSFLGQVCQEWEAEAMEAAAAGTRVVLVRIGIVLGAGGGALASMLPVFRAGLGGRLADGNQWMPWIHVDDLVGMMIHAARNESVSGAMNGVAPNPVTNREFTRTLARALHRPALFPAPRLALRIALGEFSDVLVASQRVMPRVAMESGYDFTYADLESALARILAGGRNDEDLRAA